MDFARLWEQAREVWSRPIGKVVFGGVAAFLFILAVASVMLTRQQYVTLGNFSAEDAPKVAQKLNEKKIPFKQPGTSAFTFTVPQDQLNPAKLVLAETNLDPTSSVWSPDLWKNRVSWSNTDFDKRALHVEQIEANLTRHIMALSVVERARVQITVPMEKPLFKADEKPPKAVVTILPKKGQKLTSPVVEGIMEIVSVVEGLQPSNVVVMDASTSRLVSSDTLKKKDPAQVEAEQRTDLMTIQQKYQAYWQEVLTQQLEKVVGPGNVSVIVNATINWEKANSEAIEYKGANPDGKGVMLSSQTQREVSEGINASGQVPPVGTTTNAEPRSPIYPGTTPVAGGTTSGEKTNQVLNFLVNQTKTTTERPGGAIEEISVGILVNQSRVVDDTLRKRMNDVVTIAMGKKANVQVEVMPFAEDILKALEQQKPTPVAAAPNWLYWVLGVALGLGGIGFFFVATKPRRPVLEPFFVGPGAAMMGGIPVTEVDIPPVPAAAGVHEFFGPAERKLPETAEELAQLPREEVAKLADEFLQKLGVDPEKVRVQDRVEKIAKGQPDAVAHLLRTWMSEE